MNTTRQDAWSRDEDLLLAETVLRYIRGGRTQLEAFKEVANRLSRTPAACGFRWNASIRKQYQQAIEVAKKDRKQGDSQGTVLEKGETEVEEPTLDVAISLLEKMKATYAASQKETGEVEIQYLTEEVKELKKQLKRYQEAWQEMGRLWQWVEARDDIHSRS